MYSKDNETFPKGSVHSKEESFMDGKKLYRLDGPDKKLLGVCGGFAEYFGIDPTIVRLVWAALALSGTGILLYIVAALVMPENLDVM